MADESKQNPNTSSNQEEKPIEGAEEEGAKVEETAQPQPDPGNATENLPPAADPPSEQAPDNNPQPTKQVQDDDIDTKEYWVIEINKSMMLKVLIPLILLVGLVLAYLYVPAVHNLIKR